MPPIAFPSGEFWDKVSTQTARRGFEVYSQIMSACHNISHVKLKYLENTLLTTKELEDYMQDKTVDEGLPCRDYDLGFTRSRRTRYLCREDGLESRQLSKFDAMEANNGVVPPEVCDLVNRFTFGYT